MSQYPPFGPGRCTRAPPWYWDPLNAASWPIRARLTSILLNVSQNDEVSLKSVQKASHSPYSQNGLGKSALGFLRFPYFVAFSHTELMALFDPYLEVYCQNGEVSPDVHTPVHVREGVGQYPRCPAASCFWDISSLTSARGTF